jgi:type VI secretion system protein ImpJ
MLLTPQHFHQHDIQVQQLLRHQMEQLQPYFWGLLELRHSPARLQEGTLQVDRLRAVLPDGLVVCSDRERLVDGQSPLTLDLKNDPTLRAKGRTRVYVSVPLRGEGAASERASVRRFDSFAGPASVDENTGEDPLAVLRLRPRVALSAGLAPPLNSISMPLLEVKREPGGQFALTGYHPPLLQLGASGFLERRSLQAVLERLLDKLRRKAARLAALKGNRSQNLYALTAALPPLEVLVHSERSHPFAVYQALAALVGHASALHPDGVPPLLERYQHDHMHGGFAGAVRYLDELISNLDLEYELLEFEARGADAFCLWIDPSWAGQELTLELFGAEGRDSPQLGEWIADARIASEGAREQLVQQRSPGAWSERLSAAEVSRYTQRAGAQLFRVRNRALASVPGAARVIEPGQPLWIWGGGRVPPPGRILLYWRRLGPETEALS